MAAESRSEVLNRSVTQEDIARRAGVSRSIVSRVLSNAPDTNISPATRSRVMEIARTLKYRPKTAIQRHHNIVIGIYDVDYINKPYFAPILSGIAHQTAAFDFDLQFLSMDPKIAAEQPELYFLNPSRNRNAKGYIIIDQAIDDDSILRLRETGAPFVLVDRELPGEDIPCVLSNGEKAFYDLTTYLLNRGRKKIALVTTCKEWDRERRKLKGFKQALAEHNIEFDESVVHETVLKEGIELTNVLLSVLNKNERPNAIITVRDDLAVQIIDLAHEMGLKVPEDVAVTGYNDTELASAYPVSVTSVKVPFREIGERAIILLENLIENKTVHQRRLVMDATIVIRESC